MSLEYIFKKENFEVIIALDGAEAPGIVDLFRLKNWLKKLNNY